MQKSLKIGFDFDGVIINHVPHKIALAREYGFELEPWQANSNVMKQYLPKEIHEEIRNRLYGRLTLDAPPVSGALEVLSRLPGELFVVSSRHASSIRFAQDWMMHHGVFEVIPAERIFFCTNKYEKRGHCERLGLSVFVDDQVKVLHNLPVFLQSILFDEQQIANRILIERQIEIAGGWDDIARFVGG